MAATIQTQPTQQQQSPSSLLNNNNKSSSVTNPQLKRIVYSKYRELLGSYNDKANAIIDSLPAYMVKEDRGFHFDPQIIHAAVDNVVYGTPPAPPPLSAGSVPSQRLSTQIPQYNVQEAPACVQNAMMTKDKKPFTYTPGGIDLSQIKSQRMAKRLARNAQSEGTTGQQQMHRPTQQQQSNGGSAPVSASQLGATAMGMPFQVLPTGPPPPPPQPGKVGAPPPPPPAPQNKLTPLQSNGNAPRRSPTPQNFEPPPMGFRPEIKIPVNPMASLKKVPPPQEKNNFWMDEYRKERSKSPMVGNDENDNNRSSPPNNPKPETNQYSYTNNNNNSQQNDYQQPQQNQYRAPQSPQPMRQQQQQQQEFYNQQQPSPPRTPVQQLDQQRRNECPYQTQYSQQQQSPSIQRQTSQYAPPQYQHQNSPQPQQQSPTIQRQQSQQYQNSPQHSPQVQRQQSIPIQPQQQQQQYHQSSPSPSIQRQQTVPQTQQQYQSPTSPQYQQQQQTSPTQQQQSVPWRQQKQVPLGIQNNVSRPRDVMSPAPAESPRPQPQSQQQQQQQYPSYLRSREALSPAPEQQSPQMTQPYQQKNAQVGSIYIPPVVSQQQQQQQQYSPYQDSQGSRQQQQQLQQTPRQAPTNRWMNAQGQPVENQTLNRIKSPPPPTSTTASSNGFANNNNAGLKLQINTNTPSSNGKERIIPIQLEQTPTPTRTPSAPGFGPQPFYNSAQQQQYSSVPSPPVTQGTPNNGQNSPNYVIRSPNQFVDQGYNQYPGVQEHPSRVTSPSMQQQQSSRIIQQTNTAGGGVKTRIIPIAIESQPDGPLNPNNARGPISQQPIVIQNDPRNQNTWGNTGIATPTQSKSFRILQKITDTSDDGALENKAIDSDGGSVVSGQEHQEPQLQRPSYARQMTSTGQINSPNVEQMKRMQLTNEQAYANRARNQEEEKDDKKSSASGGGGEEDPRYRGPSNPSKTFKKLQGAVERCSPSRTDQNGTPPVMKQPQPNRYVSQRPVYSPDEHSQQYVHPSEQHVPEPKIYTGSAIPSRSFKILQAMTTPENAAESDGSDVVESDTSISECPSCQQQQQQPPLSYPYPYPYLPPCCAQAHTPPPTAHQQQPPSNSSSGGDVNNWQYPIPYHPHPHHHHHHHHPYAQHHPHPHQHHPHPHHPHHPHQHPAYPYPPPPCPCYYYNFPPNGYDSQNCSSRSSLSSRSSCSRGRSQSQDLPNIIITPSTDDVPQEIKNREMARNQREGSVIDILSQKLSEISKPGSDKDLNKSPEDNKKYIGDKGKELKKSPSTNKSESENDKVSSDESSEEILSSSSDPTSSSSEECIEERSNDGLQAIRSVSNIQFYNKKIRDDSEDEDRTIAGNESLIFDEEEEEEIIGEELEYDEEEVLIEEMDSEEGEEEVFEEDDMIIMDDLSVIYEENEDLISPRPSSRISSSVSETSTLANEECEEEEAPEAVIKKENDDEEDNSNSVTVRLPLKFSFSRSSNDENIATVEVGNSQIEDKGRSFSIASIDVKPDDYETDQDCDVSVTISLSRSSESIDKKVLSASPISLIAGEVIKEAVKEEDTIWESDDEDVSVSFSLPMRNKFMDQTWSGDLTNNISLIEEKRSEDTNEKEETAVEAWRRNNSLFEENEEKKKVVVEKKTVEKVLKETIEDNSEDVLENEEREEYIKKTEDANNDNNSNESSLQNQDECEDNDDEEEEAEENDSKSSEELDFWATLQATRKEAQMFLEKTAGYWGKSVNGKERDQPISNEIQKAKDEEEERDEDFWSNIRIKKEEPAEIKEPKPKTTKLKKKKKIVKKVVVKEPEPEPEPEIKLTIIKLPNANNKSKVVESAIQMIQEKTKKPKKLVKQVSQEEVKVAKTAMENEIVQISKVVEEEKKLIEEAKIRRASLCMAKSIDEPKIEEVIVEQKEEEEKEEEDKKSKFVREKAELKTQILNQKFAKAFVIPNKPPLMKGVLSEVECEETMLRQLVSKQAIVNEVKSEVSISNHSEELAKAKAGSSEASISNEDIKVEERKNSIPMLLVSHDMESTDNSNVIEEPKKLVKKKITKTKSTEEENDGNTLKPPTKKIVKKSTKEPKKIKKKKEELNGEINIEESKLSEDKNVASKVASSEIEEKKTKVKVEEVIEAKTDVIKTLSPIVVEDKSVETEEPDFWAEIEISKSQDNLRKMQEEEAMATDPWANVKTPKESKEIKVEASKANTKEPDLWVEIESVTAKNLEKHKSLDKEPDFWAEIDLVKAKTEQTTKPQTLVESSRVKTQQKVLAGQLQTLEWFNIESFVAQHVKQTEVKTPSIMNGCLDYCEEKITKSVLKKEESQETDFWLEIDQTKVKEESKMSSNTKTDESSGTQLKSMEIEEKEPKKKLKKSISTTDTEVEPTKLKTKKKSSIPKEDINTESSSKKSDSDLPQKLKTKTKTSIPKEDSIEVKPKTIRKISTPDEESSKLDIESALKIRTKKKISTPDEESTKLDIETALKVKTKKKISIPDEESTKLDIETALKIKTKKKISTPDEESTKLDIESALKIKTKKKSKTSEDVENGEKRSSIKSKSKKKSSVTAEEETTLWSSSKPKSSKSCSLPVFSDYDIELIHADPEPIFYAIHSEPETGISFWATVSYAQEEIVEEEKEIDFWASRDAENNNSEVDTGKIDFWVTQRKFQANSNFVKDKTPSKIKRQVEEADIWTENQKQSERITQKYEEPAGEIDFWAKPQRKSEAQSNFVEDRMQLKNEEPAEEIDFWANQANNNFVENRMPMKIEEPAEEMDFWAKTRKFETNSNYVKDRIPQKIEEPAEEFDFRAKTRKFETNSNYVEDRTPPKIEEPAEEVNFWAKSRKFETKSNCFEDRIPPKNEEPAAEVDFWANTRKFETNSNYVDDRIPPKNEEPAAEVDFWAEIKGPNEDATEEHSQIDDSDLKRNNYKKAMAFFTNPISVEKKKEPKKFISLRDEEPPSWSWRPSVEPEWEAPEQRQTNDDIHLIVEDTETTTEDEPETLVENKQYLIEDNRRYHHQHEQQQNEEEESQSSESISDSTPNHFEIEHLYPKPEPEPFKPKEKPIELVGNKASEESKTSVKDRIFAFETGTVEPPPSASSTKKTKPTSLSVDSTSPNLSRNSSQRSESEIEEDDSGVTDMNKPLSETDTESESFPELRKMSPYQRASTHSRLFKLLQDDEDNIEEEQPGDEEALAAEFNYKPRKKIVHNVSITRKQNPKALQEAETVSQRRQRLSLPLRKNQSIDADNPSSPNSPASPIHGQQSQPISDKLVNELIQSLLLKKSSTSLKNLPMEKLQAAAKRVLEEELDSLDNTSLDSTPALTPQEFKNESYADYYDTWNSSKMDSDSSAANGSFEILPSKAFKVLQETAGLAKKKPWAVRCPRVLSSKTVNRDLARVTESPEINNRCSRSPEMFSDRASSVGRWKKV